MLLYLIGLFVYAIILISTVGLLLSWLFTRKLIFGKLLGFMWSGIIGLLLLVVISKKCNTKMEVTKSDIYGKYVIDRSKFPGEQADWQYENFKFRVTENDELLFSYRISKKAYVTDTFEVNFLHQYNSVRLAFDLEQDSTRHHIIADNPTLYRDIWTFTYVFKSEKFGNVFFKKKRLFN